MVEKIDVTDQVFEEAIESMLERCGVHNVEIAESKLPENTKKRLLELEHTHTSQTDCDPETNPLAWMIYRDYENAAGVKPAVGVLEDIIANSTYNVSMVMSNKKNDIIGMEKSAVLEILASVKHEFFDKYPDPDRGAKNSHLKQAASRLAFSSFVEELLGPEASVDVARLAAQKSLSEAFRG